MKINPARIASIIGCILFGLTIRVSVVEAAASLQFSPSTKSIAKDASFTINIAINTDNQDVTGSTVIVGFPTADLQVTSVTNGGFFPDMTSNVVDNKIEINAFVSTPNESKKGTGNIAIIQFKALKATGTSSVGFVCTGSSTDTQIYNTVPENILACANTNTLSVTFSSATNTVAPTIPGSTPIPTNTTAPTATQAPGANKRPDCVGLSALPAQNGTTYSDVTFSCAGRDNDGTIQAAEFFFGDGTSKKVTQNVGGYGTIMVKHQYKTAAKYSTGCRVIDNDNSASDMPAICTLSYFVSKGTAPQPTRTTGSRTGTGVVPTAEPTIPIVTLEPYMSPTPLPVDLGSADFEADVIDEDEPSSIPWQWIAVIGGIGLLILVILIILIKSLTRRREPPIPPITPSTGAEQVPPQYYAPPQEPTAQQPPPPPTTTY